VSKIIRIGVDTSKSVFQLHGVDENELPVLRRKLRRHQVLGFFAKLAPTVIGMEACGASHYWARQLAALGHKVVLIPPQYVKPYVDRGKNDAADAEASWWFTGVTILGSRLPQILDAIALGPSAQRRSHPEPDWRVAPGCAGRGRAHPPARSIAELR
jgi:hypothetical protein